MLKSKSATLRTIFALIDQFVKCNSQLFENQGKKGRKYIFKDGDVLKMLFVRDKEKVPSNRDLVCFLKTYCSQWFLKVPDHSTFCRREKKLTSVQNLLRSFILKSLLEFWDRVRLVDSTPISVIRYERSRYYDVILEASYGYCATKREKYKGFKLHMLTTISGIPTDFEVTPANIVDLKVLEELIYFYRQLTVVGDKAYLDQNKKEQLVKEQKYLIYPYKKNQSMKNSLSEKKLLRLRKRIETAFNQLKLKFNLVNHQMKTLTGLLSRILSILTSFTLIIWSNIKLKKSSILSVKHIIS